MTEKEQPSVRWSLISRAAGLAIVLMLLSAFLVGFLLGKPLDTTLTLAFLAIASFLLGAPSGLSLVVRRNGGQSR